MKKYFGGQRKEAKCFAVRVTVRTLSTVSQSGGTWSGQIKRAGVMMMSNVSDGSNLRY